MVARRLSSHARRRAFRNPITGIAGSASARDERPRCSAAGQGQRDGDAERPGGLEIEDQLDFRGKLHDREVSRLLAFENAPGIDAAQTICVRSIASIAHQTTGGGELSVLVDRWNAVAEGECAELRGVAV